MTLNPLPQAGDEGKTRKIIIAVDFGTTYSGVEWAQTARPDIRDSIVQWPDVSGSIEGKTHEQVPTEVYYNKDGEVKFGFQIPVDELRHQWFKLGLDPNQADQVSHLSVEYPDPMALPPDYDHNPVRLSADFMRCLCDHTKTVLKLKLGPGVVDSTPLEFTLTVPAIWDDAAKDRTKACAAEAGMGTNVRLVSEPEAAAVYTLDAMDPHNLKKGDRFVLCDAGGGTVDLITYEVEELHPKVRVREVVEGDGDSCGSTFLNRMFGKYLLDNFEEDDEYDDDLQAEAMRSFESSKREFTGEKPLVISVNGLADDATRGIKRGRLTVPASFVKSKFEPVISLIIQLIKKQLKHAKNAKAVLLVGGFGGSVYLRKCIERVVGDQIDVIQPAHGWTAIQKGALIWALNSSSPEDARINIASRKARKYYGLRVNLPYNYLIHDPDRKYWSDFYGHDRVQQMDWIVKKGQDIDQDTSVITSYSRHQLVSEGAFDIAVVQLYHFSSNDDTVAPRYPDHRSKRLVKLTANLSAIAETLIPMMKGKDGLDYYILNFQIRVNFFSAHTEYSLWYQDKLYGKVEAEYA